MTISRFSALPMNVSLIFGIHDLNGALFLEVSFLFLFLELLVSLTAILSFPTTYASL